MDFAWRPRLYPGLGDRPAHHQLGKLLASGRLCLALGDELARAQHEDAVGDAQHLMELVRDEDDREAFCRELLQCREQALTFLRGQHRGRLVEDEDARLAIEHFQDFDALPFADRKLADGLVGRDREAEFLGQMGEALACLRFLPNAAATVSRCRA